MSNKNQDLDLNLKHSTGKVPFYEQHSFLTVVILYLAALIIVFGPVLLKPMNTPDTMSQLYAAYVFNKDYFLTHFRLPFWMPFLAGGTPWVEGVNFNHLFDFICFLFPLQLGIGYRIIFFIFLGGIFAYLFFRSMRFSYPVSFIAGIAYMLSGDFISYAMLGHFGKTVNMTFLPLVLFFINYGFIRKNLIYFLFAGLPVAFLFKGHPQVFYYNLLFISLYFICRSLFEIYDSYRKKEKPLTTADNSPESVTKKNNPLYIFFFSVAGFTIMGIIALILASDNLLHHYMMLKLTSRGAEVDALQKWQFAISWSLHPLEMLSYLLPSVFGLQGQTYMGWRPFVSTSDYVGLSVLFIAIFGIILNWKKRHIKLFSLITVICILYGFGGFFAPYFRLFYETLPYIKSFRVPSTIYILVTFFLVYFFAYGLNTLLTSDWKRPENRKKINIFILSILVTALLMSFYVNSPIYSSHLKSGLSSKTDLNSYYEKYSVAQVDSFIDQTTRPAKEMAKSGLFSLWVFTILLAFLLFLLATGKIKQSFFLVSLTLVIFLDLWALSRNFIHPIDSYSFITEETPDIAFIKKDTSQFRIIPFPPQNDLEVGKWPAHKIESAYAYNAAALKEFDDIQNAGLLYDLRFLGLFNVKYLISSQNYQAPQIEKVFQGRKNVYFNRFFLPRVFFVDKIKIIPRQPDIIKYMKSQSFDPLKEMILEKDPGVTSLNTKGNIYETKKWDYDEIVLKVKMENPCFLFLSEVFFPRWKCTVNGKEQEIFRANYLFRSVFLEKGEYEVVFRYDDGGRYVPLTLLVLCLTLFLMFFILWNRKKYFKETP